MPLSASIISRLQYQHQTLDELISGLSENQLRQQLIAGKWSILENIAHLASYQPVFISRIDALLLTSEPSFDRYIADNDPAFIACCQKTSKALLQSIYEDRLIIINKIPGSKSSQLSRTGKHPLFGPLSLTDWTEFFLLHEAHHLFTIFRLSRQIRVQNSI